MKIYTYIAIHIFETHLTKNIHTLPPLEPLYKRFHTLDHPCIYKTHSHVLTHTPSDTHTHTHKKSKSTRLDEHLSIGELVGLEGLVAAEL